MKYSHITDRRNNKRSVHTVNCFVDALEGRNPIGLHSFGDVLKKSEELARKEFPEFEQNAFNNSRGRWYEWLIALGAMNRATSGTADSLLIKLPTTSEFDLSELYVPNVKSYITDLRLKVQRASGVSLVTSNPDFVVIRRKENIDAAIYDGVTASTIADLNEFYKKFLGQCEYEDILGFVGAKTSLRGDRRLQPPHEGSLMKALHRHIQTRLWEPSPANLKYYVMLGSKYSKADEQAMRTVATHTIVTVTAHPEAAVDKVFNVLNGTDLDGALSEILAMSQ